MNIPIVLADTSVLFPRVLRDYLMYAVLEGLLSLRWSRSILNELERTLAEQRKMTPEHAANLIALMNRALPDALVAPTADDIDRVTALRLPDETDRHVLEAAVAADADILCTANVRDFPASETLRVDVAVFTPDELLHAYMLAMPSQAAVIHGEVVNGMPETSDEATIAALNRAGAPLTAAALRTMLRI